MARLLAVLTLGLIVGYVLGGSLRSKPSLLPAKDVAGGGDSSVVVPQACAPTSTSSVSTKPANLTGKTSVPSRTASVSSGVLATNVDTVKESMSRLNFLELQKLCLDAEREWRKRTIESRLDPPPDDAQLDRDKKNFMQGVRELLPGPAYYRAESTINFDGHSLQTEAYVQFYAKGFEAAAPGVGLATASPDEVCFMMSPFFLLDGKVVNGMGSMGSCGGRLGKRGEVFFETWSLYNDKDINQFVSAILFPFPMGAGSTSGMEYLRANGQWSTANDFRWRGSSRAEFDQATQRYERLRDLTKPK